MSLGFPPNVGLHLGQTTANHYKTFINFFNDRVKFYKENVLIRYYCNGIYKTLTFGQVDHITTNLACKLSSQVANVDTVAYMSDHNASYLIVLLSILKLRKTFFTLSTRNSEAAITDLMKKTNTKFILSSQKYESLTKAAVSNLQEVQHMTLPSIDYDSILMEPLYEGHENILNFEFSDEDITKHAYILHSSGSTSFPKPMYISNRYIFDVAKCFYMNINHRGDITPITEDDVLFSSNPLFHLSGLVDNLTAILFGASMTFMEKLPPSQEELDFALGYNKVTMLLTAPYIIEQMIHYLKQKQDFTNVKNLKYVTFGGAALKTEIIIWLKDNGITARNVYGLTETGTVLCSDMNPNSNSCNSLRPFHPPDFYNFEQEDPNDPDVFHLVITAKSTTLATNAPNRPDGGFNTNDLFRKDPENPGFYLYIGRRDDTLVMINGEKTNPLPMEATIRECPMVKQVAVLGSSRECTCALVEINTNYAWNFAPIDIINAVKNAVEKANKECPNHSFIFPEMIKILPFKDKLPVTDKGSLMRKKAAEQYKDILNTLYDNFLNARTTAATTNSCANGKSIIHLDPSTWTVEQLKEFLTDCISKVLKIPSSNLSDHTQSIFDFGFNSIKSIQLRNYICEYFDISQNFLFQYSTIQSIADALMKKKNNEALIDENMRYQQTQDLASHYIEKAKIDFPVALNNYPKDQDSVILLTGATGSLGSFILSDLLKDNSVKKVYCVIRGKSDLLHKRLVESFRSRYLDVSLIQDTDRLEVLSLDFNDELLGFSQERYNQLKQEITIVQHCGWVLDFNMPIDYYDKECIAPFYKLLKFAYHQENPMHVHFISSVSASAALGRKIKEEPLPFDSHVAMPMGYAQSKFIVEVLLNYLTTEINFPCYVERVGQVCGDSIHGVWNTTEQYPIMLIGGGHTMHKMPMLETDVNWIPVDYASKSIVDIMKYTAMKSADISESIYHIVNPTSISWNDLLESLRNTGIIFDTISVKEWIESVSNDSNNPCHRLSYFYENNLSQVSEIIQWKTDKTRVIAPIITESPVVNTDLLQKYLRHWKEVGFYNV